MADLSSLISLASLVCCVGVLCTVKSNQKVRHATPPVTSADVYDALRQVAEVRHASQRLLTEIGSKGVSTGKVAEQIDVLRARLLALGYRPTAFPIAEELYYAGHVLRTELERQREGEPERPELIAAREEVENVQRVLRNFDAEVESYLIPYARRFALAPAGGQPAQAGCCGGRTEKGCSC